VEGAIPEQQQDSIERLGAAAVGAAVGSRVGKDSVETVNEDSFEGEALGFRTKQIAHAHDEGDMALEAPTQFAGRRGDPAQLCNDNFLAIAQSLD
jgi:hypothetical protein